jgi:hypothetical protein
LRFDPKELDSLAVSFIFFWPRLKNDPREEHWKIWKLEDWRKT